MKANSPDPRYAEDIEDVNPEEEEEFLYVGDVEEIADDELAMQQPMEDEEGEGDDGPEMTDDSYATFSLHADSVFCGSVHPEGVLCVTGGEDNKAYVWNAETNEVVAGGEEHPDSVVIAAFSFDGAYVATADMAGNVFAKKAPSNDVKEWKTAWEYQAGDLNWGFWHPAAHVLICGSAAGEVFVWKIPSGETKVLQGHGKSATCGKLLKDRKRLAVGYDDGSLKIWDLKTAAALHSFPPIDEEGTSVNSLDTHHDNNLIVAGYLGGQVQLVKSAIGKVCGSISIGNDPIESVKFSEDPTLGLLAIATLKGNISIWDVARQTIRCKCTRDEDEDWGVTTMFWIDQYIVAAFLSGCVSVFDGKSGERLKTLGGHKSEILDMSYCDKTKTLLTTSGDSTCKLFKLDVTQL